MPKLFVPPREILANAKVRYVGEPVVLLLAESLAEARLVWPDRGSNLCVHWESHESEPIERAFSRAVKTVCLELVNNRIMGSPLEPRVATVTCDPETDVRTLYSPTQGGIRAQSVLAELIFKIPKRRREWSHEMSVEVLVFVASFFLSLS